ncbi:MAG TPA: hypothetical protein VJM53_01255 [Burkholderiales bacterium]|jgi:uncharacterized membrane protein|nr:hypothetical protein [Burkholderiales bacterium]
MATMDEQGRVDPVPSVISIAQLVYALHTFAIVVGLIGAATTVVGSFLGSLPSIVAVILNYVKRGDAKGSWAESHYRWQIRTFWFALLWLLVGWTLILTVVGIVVGGPLLLILPVWLIYRIVRGWLRLNDKKAMYV